MTLRSKLLKAAHEEAVFGEYLVENGGLENSFTAGGFDPSSGRCVTSDWFTDGIFRNSQPRAPSPNRMSLSEHFLAAQLRLGDRIDQPMQNSCHCAWRALLFVSTLLE
jgi:hypothetical protein